MVTCGGQATIPILAAVSRVAIRYAEIVASIAIHGPTICDKLPKPPRRRLKKSAARQGQSDYCTEPGGPPLMMRDTSTS
ncbi:hypothetical protein ACB309_15860 [Klebsiella pneumoniae]